MEALALGIILCLSNLFIIAPRINYRAIKRGNGEMYKYVWWEKIYTFLLLLIVAPTIYGISYYGAKMFVEITTKDYLIVIIFFILAALIIGISVKTSKLINKDYIEKKSKEENFTYNEKKFF